MNKKVIACICVAFVLCFAMAAVSNAAEECKSTTGQAKSFWQKLFNYPANVTKESVNTVAEAGKDTTAVVTEEVKTVGQVTSGNVEKTANLATDPVQGTADAAKKAVESTVKIPTEAAK